MQPLFDALTPGEPDWRLAQAIDPSRLPAHIAVIMDGNGRWASLLRLPRAAGHRAGVEPVRATVETCVRLGIRALTLYAFSQENWKRPRVEVEALWHLLRTYLRKELDTLIRHNIRFWPIGRVSALPASVREELQAAVEATAGCTGLRLNVAINYGARAELVDAMNEILRRARDERRLEKLVVDEETVSSALSTSGLPDPDLLIRTSGEMRVSNFLLWQIAYAEIYVTDTLWPDFGRGELLRAILAYQQRERRFGGLGSAAPAASNPLPEAIGITSR